MPKSKSASSLIELIMAIILMSLVLLGFFSIDLFSRNHVISSDKRVKVQNQISYALDYISKYVQQGVGEFDNPAIRRYPAAGVQTGFQVRVDLNTPRTPGNLVDDPWITFYLDGNALKVIFIATTEVLSEKIISNFSATVMPDYPTAGFYARITDNGMAVDVGLVGRYDPAVAVSSDNPQIAMKTRLVCPSSPAQ
ncbi:MAG: hypothetical protein WC731_02815 [Candidatus Omnitrophota bacterium]|jgi:hypothetical protein